MTFDQPTAPTPVLVAIDIAKHRHEVLIEEPGRRRRRRISIRNTADDHDRLVETLAGFNRPVRIGFEPTGDYHRPLAWRLHQAGFELRLISSMSLARTREAMHNSWDKNDPKDAQVMLHMLSIGVCLHWHDPLVHATNDLQELSKTHATVSRSKTEIWHRLMTHYLPLYFPEAERFKGNSRSDWFLAFLERFPTPSAINAYDKQAFIKAAWPVIGRKIFKKRLLGDIYETAQRSIALPVEPDSIAIEMFRMVLAQGRALVAQRDAIEERAHALLSEHADYQLLRTIPGIGPINALTILAEAGDLRRFAHHRQFLKFCGFNLSTQRSGLYRGQTRLSKFGNARLRRTFWLAGQVAIRQCDNSFRDKYERYIAKDRDNADLKRKALTAVAAKVARTAHAVIKTETEYRPFHDGADPGRRTLSVCAVEARETATS
jgi:transposase